ncbi:MULTISPECIES: cell envelope integrity protein TolA [unclassified Gilliamella]|uniref:cell envelope integrity protein TolA n=1 Tax=unclassified Gilliamella TaxID=2685620 RepID=UPI00226A3C76|nr:MULTISPECIES: cell envelope integrity protein TolA [unclassified Gilliamella]MCX8663921.1 cell envelope integrity protein TolA [Gilliamella sp. B2887]MCX8697959.1 cell envelope integrity protein TolA [Gilliamella sp. B3000]
MRNSKLSIPIIISIILHLILIIILGYQAMQEKDSVDYGKETGNSIDAIMIDPSVMSDQHQRHLKTKESQQQADKKREQQVADQAKELQEKQLAEQQYLKDLTKERIKIAEQLKQQEAERIAAEKAAAEKAAAERAAAEKAAAEKAAAERAAAERAAAERAAAEKAAAEGAAAERAAAERAAAEKAAAEKAAVERAAAEKAAAEKAAAEKAAAEKAAAEKAAAERAAAEKARQKAEQAKKDKALNDLLGGLTSGSPNSPSNLSGAAASRRGSSDDELAKYKALVTNAISNKFINPANVYSGKSCVLQIQIAPDGLLLNVAASGGDDALCREAVAATKLATIPKPAIGLYDKVKKMIVEFQPK